MGRKPDRITAMRNLICQVKEYFPLNAPDYFICGPKGNCMGCSKKLLEFVDSELTYWESAMDNSITPSFGEINRLASLCKKVHRVLLRNRILPSDDTNSNQN